MAEYIIIIVVIGIFCIGIFMMLGKGVNWQQRSNVRKLTGSADHDQVWDAEGILGPQIDKERQRENLMTGE